MSNIEQNSFISAVIYAYNVGESIAKFMEQIHDVLKRNFIKFELILVNDGSTDGTHKAIEEAAGKLKGSIITLLTMSYFHGLEAAMGAGIDLAIGDFVFEFDTTVMDYDAQCIMDVFERSLLGFDIVSAVPHKRISMASRCFYSLYNHNSGSISSLQTETFRVLSRRAINRVRGMTSITPYRKAAYANCGLKMDAVIYQPLHDVRLLKKADIKVKRARRALAIDSLVLFTNVFYRFSIVMAMILMGIALLSGIYAVMIFLRGNPVEGWTTMVLILSVAFFGVFLMFAIMMKYLSILTHCTSDKQRYVFESIEKLTG